jgi:hypothetical protein
MAKTKTKTSGDVPGQIALRSSPRKQDTTLRKDKGKGKQPTPLTADALDGAAPASELAVEQPAEPPSPWSWTSLTDSSSSRVTPLCTRDGRCVVMCGPAARCELTEELTDTSSLPSARPSKFTPLLLGLLSLLSLPGLWAYELHRLLLMRAHTRT